MSKEQAVPFLWVPKACLIPFYFLEVFGVSPLSYHLEARHYFYLCFLVKCIYLLNQHSDAINSLDPLNSYKDPGPLNSHKSLLSLFFVNWNLMFHFALCFDFAFYDPCGICRNATIVVTLSLETDCTFFCDSSKLIEWLTRLYYITCCERKAVERGASSSQKEEFWNKGGGVELYVWRGGWGRTAG